MTAQPRQHRRPPGAAARNATKASPNSQQRTQPRTRRPPSPPPEAAPTHTHGRPPFLWMGQITHTSQHPPTPETAPPQRSRSQGSTAQPLNTASPGPPKNHARTRPQPASAGRPARPEAPNPQPSARPGLQTNGPPDRRGHRPQRHQSRPKTANNAALTSAGRSRVTATSPHPRPKQHPPTPRTGPPFFVDGACRGRQASTHPHPRRPRTGRERAQPARHQPTTAWG